MKVREAIEQLKKYDQELEFIGVTYERGEAEYVPTVEFRKVPGDMYVAVSVWGRPIGSVWNDKLDEEGNWQDPEMRTYSKDTEYE